ncbi:uncharacterized protein [Miscanthus floridulus]|uniref:uncharacterized protein isoform X2 n=1 Tax=Miscanthus floridulus TaxID=154761 RepID=UPI00345A2634
MKTFGDRLLHGNLSDDDFFRYFMVVALFSFLCPNSSTLPSPKYLGALIDVKSVKDWDWSKFVFQWLWSSILTYRKKKRQTIGGCWYFFAAYLDFVNFGSRKPVPQKLPRILCWKGSMIKDYSSYDYVSSDKYEKRPVKSIEETCYAESLLLDDACASFRKSLDTDCYFLSPQEMYERHGRGVHDDPMPGNSDGRIPSTANVSEKDYQPMFDDHAAPMCDEDYEPMGHGARIPMPAGSTTNIVEDVAPTMPATTTVNEQVVDPIIPGPTNIVDDEVFVTKRVDSHGTYNGSTSENCAVSQATKVIPSNNSSIEGTRKRKRRNIALQSPSTNGVASRTRRGLSQCLGKSPLSYRKDDDAQEGETTSAVAGPSMDKIDNIPGLSRSLKNEHMRPYLYH